ncbi:MAG TPA: ABA4-like family protein [Polyangiaceae bacterium]|nr:ABA4-like family protein [Polyangiaceae bacterium]
MNPHNLYPFFNFGILAPWALLVFAPRWRWTQTLIHGAVVPAALCFVHGALCVALWGSMPPDAGGQSLSAVMRMFSVPWLALLCWVHYLAFDLFVGAWVVRDAARRNLPRVMVAPCVVVICFFGPVGLLLYLVVRFARCHTLALGEEAGAEARRAAAAEGASASA